MWLVSFEYEYYCQGYEKTTETLLVSAATFRGACEKIRRDPTYRNANNFINKNL